MTCAEFQEQLPLLIDSGEIEGHPHLRDCHDCNTLVRDLLYIAEQAKLLLPMKDPSPKVWNKIQNELTKEGAK